MTPYRIYDLHVASALALPELAPTANERVDLLVREDVVPTPPVDAAQLGPFVWRAGNTHTLEVPFVARYQVREGCEIIVQPASGVDADSVRVFLLGPVLAIALQQRGLLVLHGSAIRIGDDAAVFLGPSGSGKSTLAASFLQAGVPALADEIVALDRNGCLLPGIPRIGLWQDAAVRLNIDTARLSRVRPRLEKYALPFSTEIGAASVPMRWAYLLDRDLDDGVEIQPVAGMHRFQPLHDNTYNVRLFAGTALQPRHLQQCGDLAGRIHLARLSWPRHAGFDLQRLIDRLQSDMQAHP